MVRVPGVGGLGPWLLKIHFKQWAKLWANGTLGLFPVVTATQIENTNARLGSIVRHLPTPRRIKKSIAWRYRGRRERWSERQTSVELPDYFLVEVYSPEPAGVALTLYIRSRSNELGTPFSAKFIVQPGLQRFCFPVATIRESVNLDEPFHLEVSPSESEARPTLYFGCIDFVRDPDFAKSGPRGSCKCVVWDLDNTVWDGILVEDGSDGIALKPGIREIFQELDRRGILLSVASKNNPEEALLVMQRFGLAEYLLKPQISWEPKSQAVQTIAHSLNIGLDSMLYVDDSPFERAEVSQACPGVRVIDAADASWLLWRHECQVSETEEGARRRLLYREEEHRGEARDETGGDYEAFLRDCKIKVCVLPLTEILLPRVHELAQRTNQMNFSGTRYDYGELARISANPNLSGFAIGVEDRFGSYGIVGFAVMDRSGNTLTDLAFSCRIQSKRIEHAFLAHLLREFPVRPFRARWRKTSRNAPAGRVFGDLGFLEINESNGVTGLEFSAQEMPSFDFITVEKEIAS